MGVPVVTLAGCRHAARVGASLLTHADLAELVATDQTGFIDIAAALAADPDRLSVLRAGLRGRFQASPLYDAEGFADKIERAYRAVWRRWCAGAG
jgi:protein O-GlcNAc transferase